jgi:hypothetical protein
MPEVTVPDSPRGAPTATTGWPTFTDDDDPSVMGVNDVVTVRDERIPEGVPMSAGYVSGVPRLGIPPLLMSDASLGVTNPRIPVGRHRHGAACRDCAGGELQPGVGSPVGADARPGGTADRRLLARFDGPDGFTGCWRIADGTHRIAVGKSANDLALTADTPMRGS